MKKILDEKTLFTIFEILLVIKAIFASTQIIGGVVIYFISQESILYYTNLLAHSEILNGSSHFITSHHDVIANHLLAWAQNFSISTRNFVSFYLITHGVIKLWLIIGLLRRKLWYYPLANCVFILFMVYQIYRYTFTHSIMLIFLTFVDVFIIALTWHEYRYLSSQKHEISK